jgi:two-component system nitrogen regulation sensor histidine kinase NtrY
MVDEFSSFARMPKPVFREESLLDAAHQVLFLHEVAHPGIRFALVHDDVVPALVCDRRQIGQALTNIVKNAAEAIEARPEGADPGEITLTIAGAAHEAVVIAVADNGVGLPAARERITEPYMTTRVRGTGLGLAIVKKIVEEHFGTIAFTDRPGGGTIVTMTFDAAALERLDQGGIAAANATGELGDDRQLAVLSPNRT